MQNLVGAAPHLCLMPDEEAVASTSEPIIVPPFSKVGGAGFQNITFPSTMLASACQRDSRLSAEMFSLISFTMLHTLKIETGLYRPTDPNKRTSGTNVMEQRLLLAAEVHETLDIYKLGKKSSFQRIWNLVTNIHSSSSINCIKKYQKHCDRYLFQVIINRIHAGK